MGDGNFSNSVWHGPVWLFGLILRMDGLAWHFSPAVQKNNPGEENKKEFLPLDIVI